MKTRRTLQRNHRKRGESQSVALVGYTNAGKTTLFNRLCVTAQDADNRVFETLDTTMWRWMLAPGSFAILSDTVGFIDDLPPDLVHSFRATLEEILYADVIIHLHDYHAPKHHLGVVQDIVADILNDVDEVDRPPILTVYNKCEDLSHEELDALGRKSIIAISGPGGDNVDLLVTQVQHCLEGAVRLQKWLLRPDAGVVIAWMYQNAHVVRCDAEDEKIAIEAHLSMKKSQQLQSTIAKKGWQQFFL